MNTNSNTYTIVYASVMVVIVAFLLAFVSSSLKDKQNENVELDKKKQILSALNVDLKGADVAQLYSDIVLKEQILSTTGAVIAETGAFDIDSKVENAKPLAERNLPLYICQMNGATKYVLPVYGAGLWGPIWGYIALNDDKSTIYGVYFSHAGETPGLGAEIAAPAFQNQFTSTAKHITRNGEFTSVGVVKAGKIDEGRDYVNAISGGTITSQGVEAMLFDGLGQYVEFLKQ